MLFTLPWSLPAPAPSSPDIIRACLLPLSCLALWSVALTLLSRLLQLSELSSLLTVHLHLALVEMVTLVTTAIEHWSPMSVAVGPCLLTAPAAMHHPSRFVMPIPLLYQLDAATCPTYYCRSPIASQTPQMTLLLPGTSKPEGGASNAPSLAAPKWFRARDRWSMSRFRRARSRSELFSAALSCSVSRSSFSRLLLSCARCGRTCLLSWPCPRCYLRASSRRRVTRLARRRAILSSDSRPKGARL